MKEIIKDELLETMTTTLKEYEERTHTTTLTSCQLCVLYHQTQSCSSCPMYVFFDSQGHIYPCMNRKCRPVACISDWHASVKSNDIRLKAVIQFYKLAIKHVKTLTDDDFKGSNPFNFLVDIDNEIADKLTLPKYY
jgi:hypothetical protein